MISQHILKARGKWHQLAPQDGASQMAHGPGGKGRNGGAQKEPSGKVAAQELPYGRWGPATVCGASSASATSFCCPPASSVLVLMSLSTAVLGEIHCVPADTGWPSPMGPAQTSPPVEFAGFTLKTVSNDKMQFSQVATVASPENHPKQPFQKGSTHLQQTPPGKEGSHLGCPGLPKGPACPTCPTTLVLDVLGLKETERDRYEILWHSALPVTETL